MNKGRISYVVTCIRLGLCSLLKTWLAPKSNTINNQPSMKPEEKMGTHTGLRPPFTGPTLPGSCALPATELLPLEEGRQASSSSSSIGSDNSGEGAERTKEITVQGLRTAKPQGTAREGMPAVLSMADMVTHQNPAYSQEAAAVQPVDHVAPTSVAANVTMPRVDIHSLPSTQNQSTQSMASNFTAAQQRPEQPFRQPELTFMTAAPQPLPAASTATSLDPQHSGTFPLSAPLPPSRHTSGTPSSLERAPSAFLSSQRNAVEPDAATHAQCTPSLAAVYGELMQSSAQALRAAGAVAGELAPMDDDNSRRTMKLRTASILARQARQQHQAAASASASNNSSPSNRQAVSSVRSATSAVEVTPKAARVAVQDVRVQDTRPAAAGAAAGPSPLLQHANPTIQALGQMTQYMTGAHVAELPPDDSRRRIQRQVSRVSKGTAGTAIDVLAGPDRVMVRQTSVLPATSSPRPSDSLAAGAPANLSSNSASANSSPRQQGLSNTATNIAEPASAVGMSPQGRVTRRTSSQMPGDELAAAEGTVANEFVPPRSGQLPRMDIDNLRTHSIQPLQDDPFAKASQQRADNDEDKSPDDEQGPYLDGDTRGARRRPPWDDPNHADSSGHFSGDVAEQLDALGLFAGADEDDDEDRQHDFEKVFSRRTRWYKMRYWRIYLSFQAVALLLMFIGLIWQAKVANTYDVNIGVYRWFYFFAGFPPIWLFADIVLHYAFRWLEWFFFRESLLYLHNVQRNTVTFVFLLLLLPWYRAMFVWAWCGDGECEAHGYTVVVDTVWNILLCVMLFSLANLIKTLVAKLLSTHFYRSAHFQKLNTALEKEVFLQALSRPKRKVIEEREHLQAEQLKSNVFSKLFSPDSPSPPSPPQPSSPPKGGTGATADVAAQDVSPLDHISNVRSPAPGSDSTTDSGTDGSVHVTMKGDGSAAEKQDTSQHSVQLHRGRVLLAYETTASVSPMEPGLFKATPKLDRNSMGNVEVSSKSTPVGQDLARRSVSMGRDELRTSLATTSVHDGMRALMPASRASVPAVAPDPHKRVEQNLKETSKRIMGASLAHHTAPRDIHFVPAWAPRAVPHSPQHASDDVAVHLRATSDANAPIKLLLEAVREEEDDGAEHPNTARNGPGSLGQAVMVPASMTAGPAMPTMFAMPNFMQMMPSTSMAPAGAVPRPAMAYFSNPTDGSSPAYSFAMLPSAPLGSPVLPSLSRSAARSESPAQQRYTSPGAQRSANNSNVQLSDTSLNPSLNPAVNRGTSRMAPGSHTAASDKQQARAASTVSGSHGVARPGSVPPLRPRSPFAGHQPPHAEAGLPPRPPAAPYHTEHAKVVVSGSVPPPPPRTAPLPPPPMPLPWPFGKHHHQDQPTTSAPTAGSIEGISPANQARTDGQLTITVHAPAGDSNAATATSPVSASAALSSSPQPTSQPIADQKADRKVVAVPPRIITTYLDVPSQTLPPIEEGLVASPSKLEAASPTLLKSNSNIRRNATIQRTSRSGLGGDGPIARRRSNIADSVTSAERTRRGTSAAPTLGPMATDIVQAVPLKSTQNKDITQMTEAELERVRTAVVIKTYAAIVRNYSSLTTEELEQELTAIKAFSRALFHNIRGENSRPYLTIEDFDMFFDNPDHTARAFAVFDVDGDGHVSRKEVREAVEAIFRERANMADSLRDTDAIVQSLEFAVGAIVHFLFLAFYLLIFGVNIVQGFSTFSATLVAFAFIFGNAVKNMFEALLFLFVMHPFDVGDNISVDGNLYRVKKITLLITEVVCGTGERMYFPNTFLISKTIINMTRSGTKTEVVKIQVDVGVPPDVLADIMAAMVELCQASPTEYDGLPFIQYLEIAVPMKVVLLATWTYAFPPDNWKRLVPARNAMYGILQAKLYEHRLKHTVQEVNRNVVPQLPGYDTTTGVPFM